MAAPHITGLLALIAAHHPAIAAAPRDATRVDRLFQIAIAGATSIGLDSVHGGAGLPSVAAALKSAAPASVAAPSTPQPGYAPAAGLDIEKIVKAIVFQLQSAAARQGASPSFVG